MSAYLGSLKKLAVSAIRKILKQKSPNVNEGLFEVFPKMPKLLKLFAFNMKVKITPCHVEVQIFLAFTALSFK